MPFTPNVKQKALVKSGRRCCVCHVFAGREAEVHHIVPESESGPSTLDNAIVLCQRCHGEAGHYNAQHPLGNKYSRDELRKHRDLWWNACERVSEISFPEDPICIRPGRIALFDSGRQRHGEFVVSNRTNDPYWQVWIHFSLQPSTVDIAHLDIGITEGSPHETRAKRVGDLSLDSLHLITHDDAGRKLRFFMIDRLRPAQYIYFIARLPPTTGFCGSLELCLDLWTFGTTPLMLGFKDGHRVLDLQFPLPLKGEFRIWCCGSYPIQE
ncbi:MAG: HNH endonuclease [Desulfomonile tiedjei]|nr:HNH endonuclease [Desulfomonile tiedjei]